ncbi:alpha-taxilin [Caerostris extrusa]|uniref:Alpha-taxilin n=1 Tax=Caerostris extrusa TaxID=172846 RepID=A0AAV4T9Y6_CAEEX|nr:alpha-taxilin [Caerostris extrusa]
MDVHQENQNNICDKNSEFQAEDTMEPVLNTSCIEENDKQPSEMKQENLIVNKKCDDDDGDDYSLDDIIPSEAAATNIDQTFLLDDPELVIPEHLNAAYKNIMVVCSSTAQSIKKTISEVLNNRESVVITEVDPATELQESLNKKIADFEKTVSSCFESSSENNNMKSENSPQSNDDTTEENKEAETSEDNISADKVEKNTNDAMLNTKSTNITVNDLAMKTDIKAGIEKRESTPEISVENSNVASTSQLQQIYWLSEINKSASCNQIIYKLKTELLFGNNDNDI